MKKQLLLVLTIVMLMFTAAFSASARDCDTDGHSFTQPVRAEDVVAPTCDSPGYTIYRCECGAFTKDDYVEPLGHIFTCLSDECDCTSGFVKADDGSYRNYQVCHREYKDDNGIITGTCDYEGNERDEKDDNNEVVYYLVQFINGQSLATKDESIKYTVLAKTTEHVALQSNYVKKGGEVAYAGSKPYRFKDTKYGAYRFEGWTTEDLDVVSDTTVVEGSTDHYNVVIENVQTNLDFFAAWHPENVYYEIIVYNSDRQQLLKPQKVLHGQSISYDYSYAPRESTTSVDFDFAGWIIGTQNNTVENAGAANSTFNYYPVPIPEGQLHIKEVPIYDQQAITAYHKAITRQYKVAFCDENWNVTDEKFRQTVAYNSDVRDSLSALGYTYVKEDSNYIYSYTGKWETKSGHALSLASLALPAGSLDWDDKIYLYNANMDFVVNQYGTLVTAEELYTHYEEELENYKQSVTNGTLYVPGEMFDLSSFVYLFPVNAKGEYILDENGRKTCLVLDATSKDYGIFLIDANGLRIDYTGEIGCQELDRDLRTIKIRPVYNKRANTYVVDMDIRIPADEEFPDDYKASFIVQITDKNGYLLDSGKSVYDETTGKHTCRLYVTKSAKYTISVVSDNEKYVSEKVIVWDVFNAMLNDKGQVKEPIIMDMKVSDSYSEAETKRCSCICHSSIFQPLWVRILNVIYSIFKVKVVCCYDMYASIGYLLIYS